MKIQEIWDKMNKSEKSGCKFGMFPSWIMAYNLTTEEISELMNKTKEAANVQP